MVHFMMCGSADLAIVPDARLKCALGSTSRSGRANTSADATSAVTDRWFTLVYAAQELHEPLLDLTGIPGIDVLRVEEI